MKKTLLIFGADGALGRGVTETLSQKDYDNIYLFDFNFHDSSLKDNSIKKIIISDLTKEENVSDAFKDIKPGKDNSFFLFSTIGGFFGGKSVWETSVDDFEKMFSMNLRSNFLIAKHFSKIVSQSSSGSACFTAAYTALSAEPKKAAYGLSKASLVHLVKSLSLEGKAINLSVNAIAPYIIDTPANREWMKDTDLESVMKPPEIGELIHSIFLNYNFVTGNIIELTHRFKVN